MSLLIRAVARKKLQPRRTHGPLYEISRMKSSNIISLIKKIKIDSIWQNFTEASASVCLILATAVLMPLHEKFLQFDWLRAEVFQLNLKYLHVKITKPLICT